MAAAAMRPARWIIPSFLVIRCSPKQQVRVFQRVHQALKLLLDQVWIPWSTGLAALPSVGMCTTLRNGGLCGVAECGGIISAASAEDEMGIVMKPARGSEGVTEEVRGGHRGGQRGFAGDEMAIVMKPARPRAPAEHQAAQVPLKP
eukprot:4830701-Pyramimonas_sp.AAC.1